jgi:hypothetical protein
VTNILIIRDSLVTIDIKWTYIPVLHIIVLCGFLVVFNNSLIHMFNNVYILYSYIINRGYVLTKSTSCCLFWLYIESMNYEWMNEQTVPFPQQFVMPFHEN